MTNECTDEQFIKDVANHQMFVELNQGIYRHLIFRQPEHSFVHRFEIITTPHLLTITGDMGTWSFSRIEDMFGFFRNSKELAINKSYWTEKLQNGVFGSSKLAKQYDGDKYKARIFDTLENYDLTENQIKQLKEALDDLDWDDPAVGRDLYDFQIDLDPDQGHRYHTFQLQDIWEISDDTYIYQYVWCLYAIVWGIQQYDKALAEAIKK